MSRHLSISFVLAMFVSLAACGGGSLDVSESETPDSGTTDFNQTDSGTYLQPADAGSTAIDMDTPIDGGSESDAGNNDDDAGEPYMPPTENVPQSGPTVATQIRESCTTAAVKGLSMQLIEQMNCLEPGIMKSFAGAPDISYGGAVFPFMQGPATDSFTTTAANYAGTIPVNSATRTIPQQFLLYRWYQLGLCNANLAASPGRSNHNGGLAVDIGDSGTWAPRMRQNSFDDNVSSEPWHFYFIGAGGRDVRDLSVLAFQQLYNLNFPEDPIDEDGAYGPQTEGALEAAPANGFAEPPFCPSTRSLQAFPWSIPVDTRAEHDGEEWHVQTIVPSGVTEVEYWLDDELVDVVSRERHPHFEANLRGAGELTVVARSPAAGLAQVAAGFLGDDGFFILPFDAGLVSAGWHDGDVVVIPVDQL